MRSHGAYFGASNVRGCPEATEADFLCTMSSVADATLVDVKLDRLWLVDETGRPILRLLICESVSVSRVDPVFISDGLDNDVVDLLPKLFNNVLNFLFDIFMIGGVKIMLGF